MTTGSPRGVRLAPHVAVVSLGYVVFAYAAVPLSLTTRLGIDFASFGLLTSAALGAFVVAQPLASRLTDRYPTARLLLWSVVLHALLAVVLDLVASFLALLVLRAVWGVVGGFVLSVGATQLARSHTGTATTRQHGIYGALITVGGAAGFLFTPGFVDVATTTPGIGPIHAPGALLALPAIAVSLAVRNDETTRPPSESGAEAGSASDAVSPADPDPGSDPDPRPPVGAASTADGGGGRVSVLRHPVVLLAALSYVAIIGSFVTLSTFVTAYYTDVGIVGPLSALVLLVAALGRSVGGVAVANGWLTDARVIAGGTGLAVVGFGALSLSLPTALVLVLPPVAMLAVSLPFGAVYAVAARATPRDGAALAVVVAAGNVGSIVLPAATGAARDVTGAYGTGFLALAALNLLAFGGVLRYRNRFGW